MAQLTHGDYERLERSVNRRLRISVQRRGTEYLVVPESVELERGREVIRARHPSTGDSLSLYLDEIDSFEVID